MTGLCPELATRKPEVEELIRVLTTQLVSRFAPIGLDAKEAKSQFGLDKALATVCARAGKTEYTLEFGKGEGPRQRGRITR